MTKVSAQLKTAKYIRRKSKRSSSLKVKTSCSPRWLVYTVLLSPLLLVDLLLSSLLWLHTMVYQVTMYGVYIGLFVFCHATGLTHKLERTQRERETHSVHRKPLEDRTEDRTEDESGYLSDSDCDE